MQLNVVTTLWKVAWYRRHLRTLLVTGCEETKTQIPNEKFLFFIYFY
jgi:hypothetical protein